ncbi:centromere protein F isoform X4 [Thalassophryne amazonica]|uniref:centromere protein F isoform X4 n=1 Tax=Thalassophryne amazonica TaxID=390379 RepID=UPI0014715927|nr:centromere protein F isoform X4 [Thalassophryne amazonica]
MSWAEEDWTVGLSGWVLQKVKDLQVQQERLSRENKQKQLQLDNSQTALQKQTVKYEEVRDELQSVQKELWSAREEAQAGVSTRERLSQELQTKQAQVCALEGQLDTARTLNNKLTQEVKRLEEELEKLQMSPSSSVFSTPSWNVASPWEHNVGSRSKETAQQKGHSQASHVRQLQFSDTPMASLPRQQHKTAPHRHSSDQLDSFSTPSAVFPWERDELRPAPRRRTTSSPQTPSADVISHVRSESGSCGKAEDTRTETDTALLSDARSRVATLEEQLRVTSETLKSVQNEVVLSKKEVATKERNLQKVRDELSLAHTRVTQETERTSGVEQKLKQVQEELKCQRQNAESSRLHHLQRIKELEKQHQTDVMELQKECQCLQKHHQQEVNKLNQELQQARTLHNALQAQVDKMSLQKQSLDKELDTLKEKLKWTEGQLQETQKKEAQTQAKLLEAKREAEAVAVSLEQSRKKERTLEEEGRRLADERDEALCLVKELQEQKTLPVPVVQQVQFCPVGQSFSSARSGPSTFTKKVSGTTQSKWRSEEQDEKKDKITTVYPTDREPGEGIDSEHITVVHPTDSKCLQSGGHKKDGNREKESEEDSLTEKALRVSSQSGSKTSFSPSIDCDQGKDLQRENSMLRSDLHDVRDELQKRLEDLETQRRSETEARTRLKQLSRKLANQAVERKEQDKEWNAKVEKERAEAESLRETLAALETELKRWKMQGEVREAEVEDEGKKKALEDRESELIELNIQLKKQLVEVKAQLALEREERKREEGRNEDGKEELTVKIEELKAELEELKNRQTEDTLDEKKLSLNSPLTYLTLRDDERNANIVHCEKNLPSAVQHLLFCQSTNQHNTLVCETADLPQEEGKVINPDYCPLSNEGEETSSHDCLTAPSLSDQTETLSDLQKCEFITSDLAKEVERLQKEKVRETERANQCQMKLMALQRQVTCQTRQLSTAFDKQSQNISDLLAELQEKECSLSSQGEELQRCRQELDALKAEKEGEKKTQIEEKDKELKESEKQENSGKLSELQPRQEKECTAIVLTANSKSDTDTSAQRDAEILIADAEKTDRKLQTSLTEHQACGRSKLDHVQDRRTLQPFEAALVTTPPSLQQPELRIKTLTVLNRGNAAVHSGKETQVKEGTNPRHVAVLCSEDQKSHCTGELRDITTAAQQSVLQRRKADGEHLERQDTRTSMSGEEQRHINLLQQQLMAVHTKLQALSEENQQQAEELSVWRLASQPPPSFDQMFSHTDEESEAQNQVFTLRQSHLGQPQTGDMPQTPTPLPQVQTPVMGLNEPAPSCVSQNSCQVTVIREDELYLSCLSGMLQGQMLTTRMQPGTVSEQKTLQPCKKVSTLRGHIEDPTKESDKENQEVDDSEQSKMCQIQHKQERESELIQMSSDKTGVGITKDPRSHQEVFVPKQTKAEENPETKPDASRAASELAMSCHPSKIRTASTQTEECVYPLSAPTAPEVHHSYTQTEEEHKEDNELTESPTASPVPLSEATNIGDKMLLSSTFPIPADLACLAERIRRNRTQLSAAFDDTEYELYGLPEDVMKGFASIPSDPACPYIVRRALLGTAVVPIPQKETVEETD